MAQHRKPGSLLRSDQSKSLAKVDAFFDILEHVAARTERLLKMSKNLVLDLAPWMILIYELIKLGITLAKQ